jgi:hypothetical protein
MPFAFGGFIDKRVRDQDNAPRRGNGRMKDERIIITKDVLELDREEYWIVLISVNGRSSVRRRRPVESCGGNIFTPLPLES